MIFFISILKEFFKQGFYNIYIYINIKKYLLKFIMIN